ncbi:hypothetical protein LTR53_013711 [Teratosphaeriaceae sp. CCFEE 6253]|nr:hypothetical protein LTR53_013711 [Teratosphaeriaceae sp. CCFEE 6253]
MADVLTPRSSIWSGTKDLAMKLADRSDQLYGENAPSYSVGRMNENVKAGPGPRDASEESLKHPPHFTHSPSTYNNTEQPQHSIKTSSTRKYTYKMSDTRLIKLTSSLSFRTMPSISADERAAGSRLLGSLEEHAGSDGESAAGGRLLEILEENTSSDDEEDDTDSEADDDQGFQEPAVWRVGHPQPQPLIYTVPAADGGSEERIIKFTVDFNSGTSVGNANKTRATAILRRKRALGLDHLMRPTLKGREFTSVHETWIIAQYEAYAAANQNRRLPNPELTERFNEHFAGEERTGGSISSYVNRMATLKAVMMRYRDPRGWRQGVKGG